MEPCQVDPHLEQSQYALDLAETVLNHACDRHVCDGARAALIAAVLEQIAFTKALTLSDEASSASN